MPNRNKTIGLESKMVFYEPFFFFYITKTQTASLFHLLCEPCLFLDYTDSHTHTVVCISCQIDYKGLAALSQLFYLYYTLEIILGFAFVKTQRAQTQSRHILEQRFYRNFRIVTLV